ncbi:MAG: sigma 54-interacting transcriptional regulator [Clostridia bacterium]|nr:sigma 54-interacting transcriptional regulator [Clostridia bacterium]
MEMKKKSSARRPENYDAKMYKIMAEHLGEEIFVTDGDGRVIFVNPRSIELIGMPADEIIGKTSEELVEMGCFDKSVSQEVLRSGEKADIIQKLSDGRTVLATGVPVYNTNHDRILMTISTSKDVSEINRLLHTVEEQQEEIVALRQTAFEKEEFITADPKMLNLKNMIVKIATLDMPILIEGETGVGKEVAVRSIHKFSDRSDGPLFKINCGSIPANLMESELFGYEKGAFTGAEKSGKKGKIRMAEGGTLFLDEIGEMPLDLQVKLLDFLQDGYIVPVGGTKKIRVNARVVAATNRNLKEMCASGAFRQDLYYRLSVLPIHIPPLRERPLDIEALARFYVSRCNSKYHLHHTLDESFYETLKSYSWPGNVRELEHVIERVSVMADSDVLTKDNLTMMLNPDDEIGGDISRVMCIGIMPLKQAKKNLERDLVNKAYDKYGSTYKAAKALGVDQSTVVKIMKRLNASKDE